MLKLPTRRISTLGFSCIVAALLIAPQEADTKGRDRSGKEVVETFCAECHGTGVNDAPKIGDAEAWKARASLGLTALTEHALDGIRRMPPHGGHPQLTDLEIARAITYMVNASGGDWVMPESRAAITAERTGEEVVEAHCGACHRSGQEGAPRVGDKEAWIPRLQQGLRYAVRSAISGHGGMPPRGGAVNLTDAEIRKAIVYMFDPEAATATRRACCPVKKRTGPVEANHATVGGMHIYLGFVSAEKLRDYPKGSAERSMHGGIPSGDDWYHVNVTLLEQASHAPITDARVEAQVSKAGPAMSSKELEPMAIGQGSYGNYFRLRPRTSYRVSVRVRTPGSPGPVEAEFRYDHP